METSNAITSNRFIKWIINLLSPRMKRILYIASLTGVATKNNIPEENMISKLNQLLNLSVNDSALKLPIHVSQAIWNNSCVFKDDINKLVDGLDDNEQANVCAKRVVQATPSWFRYNEEQMVNDIVSLFTKGNDLFVATK